VILAWPRRRFALATLVALAATTLTAATTATRERVELPDWLRVDYSELIDRRRPSHSGESVGQLLERLGGRPVPPAGQRREDRVAHGMLDPIVEPFAFVLPDALDSAAPLHDPPYIDVGSLWLPGAAQPAWAELLRARRFVVESDGEGRLRVFLPWEEAAASGDAARAAWSEAWPILRHVLAAERRRLAGPSAERLPSLEVEVHAYRHLRERSLFELGTAEVRMTVDDTRPDGLRPPLDLREIRRFLAAGLRLEGARIGPDGGLKLLGSHADATPSILGRPLALADFAVAYRAVFHGGLAEPYMSLDRSYFAEESIINYGGRLRDTALGMVSLLCDIRFKTFSLGFDMIRGEDRRDELHAGVPGFRTHLEHLSDDPRSQELVRQQTSLWFYPDDVDLTVSPQGDVLVLRRARMSAASERLAVDGGTAGEVADAPWTRATVDEINRNYDALAGMFPEMADLDEVVRLLSLFAWLQHVERSGRLLPELETLLTAELPELATPRSFPQLIAFNLLPTPKSGNPVLVVDQVPYATAVGRLNPLSGRPLNARRRYARAVAALDPREPQDVAMLAELGEIDLDTLGDSAIDMLAYEAGRTRLLGRTSTGYYVEILNSLDAEVRQSLAERTSSGEVIRKITLGIGGLDLDMGQALSRAGGQRLALNVMPGRASVEPARPPRGVGPTTPLPAGTAAKEVREDWRRDPRGLRDIEMPPHGLGGRLSAPAVRDHGAHRLEVGEEAGKDGSRWLLALYDVDGPEARSRKAFFDRRGLVVQFEHVEQSRLLAYEFERDGALLTARSRPALSIAVAAEEGDVEDITTELVTFQLQSELDPPVDPTGVKVRLSAAVGGRPRELGASMPRALLQRLVLSPEADPFPGRSLPPVVPPAFGGISTVMVLSDPSRWTAPWDGGIPARPGEEDPRRLARALNRAWAAGGIDRVAVVGVDPTASPPRWDDAPRIGSEALLLLPDDGFPVAEDRRDALAAAWSGLPVAESLDDGETPDLVVLVSAESPARLGARLKALAQNPAMRGKLLAAWSLAGPVREDLPAALLAEGKLAGVGLAPTSVFELHIAAEKLAEMRAAVQATKAPTRPERLAGPFVWHF